MATGRLLSRGGINELNLKTQFLYPLEGKRINNLNPLTRFSYYVT
jgi:hypothetical protein